MELSDNSSLEAAGITEGGEVVVVRKVLVAEGACSALRCPGGGGTQECERTRAYATPAAGWKVATGGDSDSSTDEEDF